MEQPMKVRYFSICLCHLLTRCCISFEAHFLELAYLK